MLAHDVGDDQPAERASVDLDADGGADAVEGGEPDPVGAPEPHGVTVDRAAQAEARAGDDVGDVPTGGELGDGTVDGGVGRVRECGGEQAHVALVLGVQRLHGDDLERAGRDGAGGVEHERVHPGAGVDGPPRAQRDAVLAAAPAGQPQCDGCGEGEQERPREDEDGWLVEHLRQVAVGAA